MEHFLYVIYIDANHVMIGPPDLQHYITMVWNILYLFSSLNCMPTVKNPFPCIFFGPELMTSSPEVTTLGVDWVSFDDKNTF